MLDAGARFQGELTLRLQLSPLIRLLQNIVVTPNGIIFKNNELPRMESHLYACKNQGLINVILILYNSILYLLKLKN